MSSAPLLPTARDGGGDAFSRAIPAATDAGCATGLNTGARLPSSNLTPAVSDGCRGIFSARRATRPTDPNPYRTPKQNAVVRQFRNWGAEARMRALPPVTKDDAARLVAEYLARNAVTVCPPAARVVEPINAGIGWGAR